MENTVECDTLTLIPDPACLTCAGHGQFKHIRTGDFYLCACVIDQVEDQSKKSSSPYHGIKFSRVSGTMNDPKAIDPRASIEEFYPEELMSWQI